MQTVECVLCRAHTCISAASPAKAPAGSSKLVLLTFRLRGEMEESALPFAATLRRKTAPLTTTSPPPAVAMAPPYAVRGNVAYSNVDLSQRATLTNKR
jgi:hypothetical protein